MDIPHIKPQKYTASITEKIQLSSKVFLFTVKIADGLPFQYIPGQFINIYVSETVTRQYSICSSPRSSGEFELVVDIAPGGPGSKFFQEKQKGDTFSFVGPLGKFTLKEGEGPLVFLASGTGIAPFKAMIDTIMQQQNGNSENLQQVYLYFGFRYPTDVFWKDYFEDLSTKHKNFHFMLTLSQPDEQWNGCKGYVQSCIDLSLFAHQQARFYICGGQKMVNGVVEYLRTKRVDENAIFFEPF